ncbi:MAG: pilus assembly protein PilB, partial [Rubrivivax sp.]|nr:pilus assembly protein PilB [Rubrivivax sp.]
MSDLSSPPLSLLPIDGAELPSRLLARHRGEPFAWPTPALACYPAPTCATSPEPCEIEGLNGQLMSGLLTAFNPEDRQVHVVVPPARTPTMLRFAQFRRLRLLHPLAALPPSGSDAQAEVQAVRPVLPYTLILKGLPAVEGLTVGHVNADYGLFFFEPVDRLGTVKRSFVPSAAVLSVEVGLRIGEALVAQKSATTEQVDAALREQSQLRAQKIGDILVTRQIIQSDELVAAIQQQAKMPMVRIGEALIALGFVTEEQLDSALARQSLDRSVPLGELLVKSRIVSRQDLQTALARKMGYPLVDVRHFPVEMEAVARVPYAAARRLGVLPLMHCAGRLVVALEDPSRGDQLDEIEFAAQGKVVPVLARADMLAG